MNKLLLFGIAFAFLGSLASYSTAAWNPPCQSSSVCSWINLTLQNTQTSTFASGTQYPFVINTLNYSAYINGEANNINIYNGLTQSYPYAWLEGNTYTTNINIAPNVLQAFSLNTVNTLVIWANVPFNVPASTTATNALTLVFWQMSNTVMNGNNMGEAPYLASAQGYTCGSEDNGANVFSYYIDWGCNNKYNVLTSGAWNAVAVSTITYTTKNTIIAGTPSSGIAWVATNGLAYSMNTPGNVVDSIMNGTAGTRYWGTFSSLSAPIVGNSRMAFTSDVSGASQCVSTPKLCFVTVYSTTATYNVLSPNSVVLSNTIVFSGSYTSATTANAYVNYNLETAVGTGNANPILVSPSKTPNDWLYFGAGPISLYVTRSRKEPPNDVQPIETFGQVQSSYSPPTTPSLVLSNTLIDQGQSILFTATTSLGIPNYAYSYNVYATNTLTSSIVQIANMLFTSCTLTTNSWFWTPPANLYTGNTLFFANVFITDGYPTTVNSISNSFGYNAMLDVDISPLASTINLGQTQLWTATITPGQPSYTYNWQVYNTLGLVFNALYTGNFQTTNAFQILPLAVGNYQANIIVTDSATTQTTDNAVALLTVQSTSTSTTTSSTTSTISTSTSSTSTATTSSTSSSTSTSSTSTTTIAYNSILCINNVPTNIISNGIEYNKNSSALDIYAETNGNSIVFYGNSPSNLLEWQNISAYATNRQSLHMTMNPNTYIQFNYMGTFNQFKCQWLSGGSGTVIITEPIQAIEDDPIAYAALAIAIAFGLICLCLILLEKLKEKKQNVK